MSLNLFCPVCTGTCSLFDVVDFNKSCEEAKGKFLPLAGIPVYYARCGTCGFCFAPEIATWKPEEFETKIYNDKYVIVDPDYIEVRPRANAANLITMFGDRTHAIKHLDYGGGAGLLTKLLRESNWQSTSYDPFVDRNVSVEQLGKFDLVTAFEVFEHVPNVSELMSNLRSLLAQNGLVLFSTLLSDGHIHPNQGINWWYASPRNGHISLFSRNSLAILAQKNGFNFGSFGVGVHVFFTNMPPWAAHLERLITINAPPRQPEPPTITQSFQQAVTLHQTGQLQEAGELYLTILQTHPNHPEANYNMGMIAVQTNQPSAGLPYFMAALDADPARGQYWLSYIDALFQADQIEDARQVLALAQQQGLQGDEVEALALRLEGGALVSEQSNAESQHVLEESLPVSSTGPENSKKSPKTKPAKPDKSAGKSTLHQGKNPSPQEINTLVALFSQGRYTEAATLAQKMTVRFPLHGVGWKVLGIVFKQMGRSADALAPMQKAAALSPSDADAHNTLGITLHDLDRLDEAEASYRRALQIKPDDAQAHNNLGATLQDLGRLDEAEASYRRALQIKPDYAKAHNNLGTTLKELGRLDEAETSYRRALEIKPDDAEALNNLGITLKDLGRLDEAEASYRRALEINPDYAVALINLGNTLKELGRLDEAEASYRRALQIQPDYAKVLSNLGATLQELGRLDEAETCYRRALEIKADDAQAHNNLGATLKELDRLDEAEASYRRALQIKPDYSKAHSNLGATLKELGRLDEAVTSCRRALQIKPDNADAHCNLGIILLEMDQLDEAEASFRRALQIKPDHAEALCNLGITLKDLGRLDESEASYRRALEIKPDLAAAHNNLGHALLTMGRLSEGWQEYEYRWGTLKLLRPPTLLPQWTGQNPLPDDRLLIFKEQGMGDQLQFSRYLPLAANRFADGVSIVADRPLLALFRRSFPDVEVLDADPADQAAWQWQSPLLSLPLAFGTTLETIPKQVPYLIPDPARVTYWKSKIAALDLPSSTRKIGVVWKPGSFMKNAPSRTLTLQQLAPLLDLPGCTWFSLQKEPDPDRAPWVASGKLIDWAEEFSDFDETAALLVNLDLVVSVDTSVAHLTGGLGRPTWLFNRHAGEWRWLYDREDSPWYPTMRIFTQKKAGDWDEVVRRMATALTDMPPSPRIQKQRSMGTFKQTT